MAARKTFNHAALDEETKPRPQGPGCGVGRMLGNMTAEDAEFVDRIIRDPFRPMAIVHQALKSRRDDCPGEYSFRNHRRGRCSCKEKT